MVGRLLGHSLAGGTTKPKSLAAVRTGPQPRSKRVWCESGPDRIRHQRSPTIDPAFSRPAP